VHLTSLRRRSALLGGLLIPIMAAGAAPALAQGPGLPPGYQVQRLDAPIAVTNGGFGNLVTPFGDANGDSREDFAQYQAQGSPGNEGVIQTFSGATGALLRSTNAPDAGGAGARAASNNFLGRMEDIGSCPAASAPFDAAQPGPTCPTNPMPGPDGTGEILVGAGGVDVAGVQDVGRVYVLDGRTLAVLKRIDMPAADRTQIATLGIGGGFGRTATNPRGLPPCQGNAGVGTCPAQTGTAGIPQAVRIGDTDGAGQPDIIVGANNFPETAATAQPESHCAKNAGTTPTTAGSSPYSTTCASAGRAYVYRGEDIAGTNPATILDTPQRILKNLAAQADDQFVYKNSEIFGHSQMPIGDVGECRTGGTFPAVTAGQRCTLAASQATPDGKPDYIIMAHRADTPIFNPAQENYDVGVAFLYDGATGTILYTYYDPEPVANALFGFTTGQQFPAGQLGDSARPDAVIAGFQDVAGKAQSGRGYVFDGDFKRNFIVFSVLDDPTPNTFGRYGNPTEGLGDLVPQPAGAAPTNEVMMGQFSAVQTAGKEDTLFDVSIVQPVNEKVLQTIADPDRQPESGFGSEHMPLGDLNGDGFLDFAVSAVRWDSPSGVIDQGRIHIFRSDPNAAPVAPPQQPAPVTPTPQPAAPLAAPLATPAATAPAAAPAAAPIVRKRGRLSAAVTPSSDLRPAYVFRASGRLTLPAGVSKAAGCKGRISVQVKRGAVTISTRRASLTRNCTYSSRVAFANKRRFGTAAKLKFTVRFLGNARVSPAIAPARFARVRR